MKKAKVKIIDFYSTKNFHEIVTYCLVEMFCNVCIEVEFILGQSAYRNMQKMFQNDNKKYNLFFKPRFVVEIENSFGAFLRMLLGCFFVLYEYLITPKSTILYYNYNNPFALPFLLIVNRIFNKKVIIIFHGELELLIKSIPVYKISNLYKYIHYYSYKYLLNNSGVKALVLGHSIRQCLLDMFPVSENSIVSIEHPYIFKVKRKHAISNSKLVLGTVGHLTSDKGLYDLLKIADILKNEIEIGNLTLKVVGKKPVNIDVNIYKEIIWQLDDYIPREKFDKEVNSLDYILFLYPKDSYKLTASGALLDAISNEIPIIALKNPYFNEMLKGTNIGYLCDSIDELIGVIRMLLDTNNRTELNYENQFSLLKEKLQTSYLTDKLKEIIDLL